jgi:hypothetical protein
MPRLRSKDLARIADSAAIRAASSFRVNWLLGRGEYRNAYFTTVVDARAARDEAGSDEHGRRGLIYALCDNGAAIHVGDEYEG